MKRVSKTTPFIVCSWKGKQKNRINCKAPSLFIKLNWLWFGSMDSLCCVGLMELVFDSVSFYHLIMAITFFVNLHTPTVCKDVKVSFISL